MLHSFFSGLNFAATTPSAIHPLKTRLAGSSVLEEVGGVRYNELLGSHNCLPSLHLSNDFDTGP